MTTRRAAALTAIAAAGVIVYGVSRWDVTAAIVVFGVLLLAAAVSNL